MLVVVVHVVMCYVVSAYIIYKIEFCIQNRSDEESHVLTRARARSFARVFRDSALCTPCRATQRSVCMHASSLFLSFVLYKGVHGVFFNTRSVYGCVIITHGIRQRQYTAMSCGQKWLKLLNTMSCAIDRQILIAHCNCQPTSRVVECKTVLDFSFALYKAFLQRPLNCLENCSFSPKSNIYAGINSIIAAKFLEIV